jgi:hypothetical protein
MSVTVRPYKRGGWEVDIQWRAPNGRRQRERKRLAVMSKAVAKRWGEARERDMLLNGGNPLCQQAARRLCDCVYVPRQTFP